LYPSVVLGMLRSHENSLVVYLIKESGSVYILNILKLGLRKSGIF